MDTTRSPDYGSTTFQLLHSARPDAFAAVPSCSGKDSKGSVELTIDSAKQIVRAHIDENRFPRDLAGFRTAIQQAFQAADERRLVAAYAATGAFGGALQRSGDHFEVDTELKLPRPVDIDVSKDASLERAAMRRSSRQRPLTPRVGVSRNAYLTIQRTSRGDIREVEADQLWLSSARPENLEASIREAADYTLEVE